jgi:hypothetical protein
VLGVGAGPFGHVAGGDDQVVGTGRAAVGSLPAGKLPLGEQPGQRCVDGNTPRHLGLRTLEVDRAERLEGRVVIPPA